jgi:FkbM family methyltransferase
MDPSGLSCALKHSHSQWFEERLLLPSLLQLTGGRPGTFVELGALDGVKYSNTLALERCFNWTGLLIEANPANYEMARRAGRRAALVHAAVCAEGVGSVNVTTRGGPSAGIISAILGRDDSQRADKRHSLLREKTVRVPCRPLSRLMSDAGLAAGAHLLSLDVEGEEATVLRTAGDARFAYALVETASDAVEREVRSILASHGMTQATHLLAFNSLVFQSDASSGGAPGALMTRKRVQKSLDHGLITQRAAHNAAKHQGAEDARSSKEVSKEVPGAEGGEPSPARAQQGSASSPFPSSTMDDVRAGGGASHAGQFTAGGGASPGQYTACVLEHASAYERMLLPSLLGAAKQGAQFGIFVEVGVAAEEGDGAGGGGGAGGGAGQQHRRHQGTQPSLARTLEKCYGWRGVRLAGLHANDTLCADFDGDGGSQIMTGRRLPPCRGRSLASVARAAGFERVDYVYTSEALTVPVVSTASCNSSHYVE